MTDLERARAFEEALREGCAERLVPFRFGHALFNHSLPGVWELNVVRVERPDGATADALAAEAERLQGEAGLEHRRVTVLDEAAGATFEPRFRELGWRAERFVFMVHRRPPTKDANVGRVTEVDREALDPLRAVAIGEEAWGKDPETVRQLLAANALKARAARARHFAVLVDGVPASAADLYSDGTTAQIEDVVTLPEYRGGGLASAVVLKALHEAVASGHEVTFLVADDADWPKHLYARLGFDEVGRWYVFQKPPTSARPDETQPEGRGA